MGAAISRAQRQEAAQLKNLTVHETGFRLKWMDDPWKDVDAAGEKLLELETSFFPDIVHLNGYAHGALPWRTPVMVVAHSCVLSWWRAVHRQSAPARYAVYQQRVTEGLNSAGAVIAPSWDMLSSLSENYGFSKRGRVIFNGRQAQGYSPGVKEPLILAAGRLWDEAKNFTMLDRVASRLKWPVFCPETLPIPMAGLETLRICGCLDVFPRTLSPGI